MTTTTDSSSTSSSNTIIKTLRDLAAFADYSFLDALIADPNAKYPQPDIHPRPVPRSHFVPVLPTKLPAPVQLVAHSKSLFKELGFADSLARDPDFVAFFSGDFDGVSLFSGEESSTASPATRKTKTKLRKMAHACGYALSIFGQEYYQQCPFRNGNGYGDGRAMSVLEAVFPHAASSNRLEFQLKGGGKTPYCRGADGRAVLRSSVREFLAQEALHGMNVPTTRSLSLFVSPATTVKRPWYSPNSRSEDPDTLIDEQIAITTRVAPSFIRVGQLELFGRRARKREHPEAMRELRMLVQHAIEREYPSLLRSTAAVDAGEQAATAQLTAGTVLAFAEAFRERLTDLVADWIRVGYTQGNFNSDNTHMSCTLDFGPFGFVEVYSPLFQSWTGGGEHFAFMNQGAAAERNFASFANALRPLLAAGFDSDDVDAAAAACDGDASSSSASASASASSPATPSATTAAAAEKYLAQLADIQAQFPRVMSAKLEAMFARKMGLKEFDAPLYAEMEKLMRDTPVDFTMFWRELSAIPSDVSQLRASFYENSAKALGDKRAFDFVSDGPPLHPTYETDREGLDARWAAWLSKWRAALLADTDEKPTAALSGVSAAMKRTNPKFVPREWILADAYAQSAKGDHSLVRELADVFSRPFEEQNTAVGDDVDDGGGSSSAAERFYKKKPEQFFAVGGISHCSCSS